MNNLLKQIYLMMLAVLVIIPAAAQQRSYALIPMSGRMQLLLMYRKGLMKNLLII